MNKLHELGYLNSLPVAELVRTQRRLGRKRLPPDFVQFWAKQYRHAQHLLETPSCKDYLRSFARLLKDITYSISALDAAPIDQKPSYYPYCDCHILDGYLPHHRSTYNKRVSRAVAGIRSLLLEIHRFETASLAGLEPNHRERCDSGVLQKRLAALRKALGASKSLADPETGLTLREDAFSPHFETLQEYVDQSPAVSVLIDFTAMPQTQYHDEMLFLRTIALSELCFFAIRLLLDKAREHVSWSQAAEAESVIRQASNFAMMLHLVFEVLRTMPPLHFTDFRDATGNASAVQSVNYQRMDIVLHGINPEKIEALSKIPHLTAVLRDFGHPGYKSFGQVLQERKESNPEWKGTYEAARNLDSKLKTWRGFHTFFAKTYLPPESTGTGNTSGLSYLRRVLAFGLFDDTSIDVGAIAGMFPHEDVGGFIRLFPGINVAPPDDNRR